MNKEQYLNLMKSWLNNIIEYSKKDGRLRVTSTHIIIEHNTDTSVRHSEMNDDIVRAANINEIAE